MVADYALNLHEVDDFVFEDEHRAGFYVADDEVMYYEIPGVTHWMPLPDPPEEIQEWKRTFSASPPPEKDLETAVRRANGEYAESSDICYY